MRWLFRFLRIRGDVRALRRGPDAFGRRVVRRKASIAFSRRLRRVVKP